VGLLFRKIKILYCIIYKFKVRDGQEERFTQAWSEVTKAYIESCGGLGSRLHKADDQDYIAFAQWPSKEIQDAAELPLTIKEGSGKVMKECCESIETLYKMKPVADLLVNK